MSYPILYDQNEKNFNHNGIGVLSDCKYCMVEEEANGAFELYLKYPSDGIHFESIGYDSIIKAKPDDYRKPQLFRVYDISNTSKGLSTISARHISYDLSGIPVSAFKAQNVSDALTGLKTNASVKCDFDFWTDKTTVADFSVGVPSSVRSLLGGVAGSVLDVYGGEYEFDNYTVKLHNKRGADRGFHVRYGKNLKSVKQDKNCANVYTGVYPFWQNQETGEVVELPEKIINGPGDYQRPKIKPLDLSSDFTEKPTVEQIRASSTAYVNNSEIGVPKVSLDVSFANIEKYDGYAGFSVEERVSLFDTVSVEFEKLKISTKAKVAKVAYNVLLDRIEYVTIGSRRANISDTLARQQSYIANVPTKYDMKRAQAAATEWLTNGKGYKVERRDDNGRVIDTLYMDTPDIETAVHVMRIGQSGIGFSHNGVDGPYESAWTIDGSFVADFITSGTLNAELVNVINLIAEKLSSVSGKSELAINSAEFKLNWDGNPAVFIWNLPTTSNGIETGAKPIFYMRDLNGSYVENVLELTPHHMKLGGKTGTEPFYMYIDEGKVKLALNQIFPAKELDWKTNGDGTFTLIGRDPS